MLATGPVSAQQASVVSSASDAERGSQRIERLSDSLEQGSDWVIGMPRIDSSPGFAEAVRRGVALDSAAYRQLHGELQGALRSRSGIADDALADLRGRLRARVEANARLGYIFAAGVYIEMLEMAGAPGVEIRALTRRLAQRRAFEADFERFERAIAESRLRTPGNDSAAFWLERLRGSPVADPESIRRAEQRLQAALDVAGSGTRSP